MDINLESIVNECLRVSLKEPTPDKSIEVLLEYLGKELNGERTYIFEKNEDGTDNNTYEWVAPGISPEKDGLQNLPPEICAEWYGSFSESNNIIIKNLEELAECDTPVYNVLKRQNIHSLVVVPLYENGRVIGFFGVDNPPSDFFDYASNMLQIMGHFIGCILQRRNLVKKLEIMSYTDQLTGLGNRHAMNEFIDNSLEKCTKIGVVYCDITGLKSVNDKEGHEAGDRYIICACESLSKAFGDFGLFRIGGDEFLAICPEIEKISFDGGVDLLRNYMNENGVIMSVGVVWKMGEFNIDDIIVEAEALMYEEKALYYKKAGIKS